MAVEAGADARPIGPRAEAILEGAARAFSTRGYAATSMREIAQATGSSLGSIYYHFSSKEGILHALLCSNFRRVQTSLDERLEGVADPRQSVEVFVENHVAFFARHLEEMRVMSHELDTLEGPAGDEVADLRRSYTRRARDLLRRLRPDLPETELQVATLCLFGMLNWTYRWFHTVTPKIDAGRLSRQMSALFLDGFLGEG